ncbi:MAG: 50S ribosomal protein L15 [Chloroflexi bacterium]|nr:50S ribosomal protein L15 [Chloroflexota bacterium]
MKLHDLRPRAGSRRPKKRVGRGISAGQGKTAGRGMKGYGARSGSGGKIYHQGGNLPFYRRLPLKRGFTNFRKIAWYEVNLDELDGFAATSDVTPATLIEAGILRDAKKPIVLLGRGDVKVALHVRLHRATRGARAAIKQAGGSIEVIEV